MIGKCPRRVVVLVVLVLVLVCVCERGRERWVEGGGRLEGGGKYSRNKSL